MTSGPMLIVLPAVVGVATFAVLFSLRPVPAGLRISLRDMFLGGAGLVAFAVAVSGSGVPALLLVVAVAASSRAVPPLLAGRRERAEAGRMLVDVPDVVDLLVVAVAAGCNVYLAVAAVAAEHSGPVGDVLADGLRRMESGARFGDGLADAMASLPAPSADAVRPLVAVLVESDAYGTPLLPALTALGDDLRAHRQRRAEEHARRIPVRLLLPLVTCVLPAFALLTVAPLLAGTALDALADLTTPRPVPVPMKGLP